MTSNLPPLHLVLGILAIALAGVWGAATSDPLPPAVAGLADARPNVAVEASLPAR